MHSDFSAALSAAIENRKETIIIVIYIGTRDHRRLDFVTVHRGALYIC